MRLETLEKPIRPLEGEDASSFTLRASPKQSLPVIPWMFIFMFDILGQEEEEGYLVHAH